MTKTNDFLTRLYWAATDEEGYYGDGLNLGELYERTEEEKGYRERFSELLDRLALGQEEDEIMDAYTGGCIANEKQGFINGFRLGMKLAQEAGLGPLPE